MLALNEQFDQDIKSLGEILYKDDYIEFYQFLKIYELCVAYGKTQFA